jgi:hypothetical protein
MYCIRLHDSNFVNKLGISQHKEMGDYFWSNPTFSHNLSVSHLTAQFFLIHTLKFPSLLTHSDFHLQFSHTYLNFGIVFWGSLVQLRPLANKMFRAVATARAAGVGRVGVFGTC